MDGETAHLAAVFKSFDKNNNGKLSHRELREGYQNAGKIMSDDDIDRIIKAVDSNNSGEVDYMEFVAAALSDQKTVTEENLLAAFNRFDKDQSGFITSDELLKVLHFGGANNQGAISSVIRHVD